MDKFSTVLKKQEDATHRFVATPKVWQQIFVLHDKKTKKIF